MANHPMFVFEIDGMQYGYTHSDVDHGYQSYTTIMSVSEALPAAVCHKPPRLYGSQQCGRPWKASRAGLSLLPDPWSWGTGL